MKIKFEIEKMSRRSVFPRLTIHTDYYYRNFVTKTCTTGYCFAVVITIIVIFLPFLTTFSTGCKSTVQSCLSHAICQSFGREWRSLKNTQRSSSKTSCTQSFCSSMKQTVECTLSNTPRSRGSVTSHPTYWLLQPSNQWVLIEIKMA